MGNAFALILKYGQYLKFLPLLVALVRFIREAQQKFRDAATGADKAAWVQSQFSMLVDLCVSVGLIGEDFAKTLRDGSLQIISMFVQGIKEVHGTVPPLEGDPTSAPASATGFRYEKVMDTEPDRSLLKTGDTIAQHGTDQRWIVRQGGVGIGALPAPWHVIETID